MTDYEVLQSYRTAKDKAQQIQIIAELSGKKNTEIIKILVRNKEELPTKIVNRLFRQLDKLEEQIKEREREYREIVAALTGGGR